MEEKIVDLKKLISETQILIQGQYIKLSEAVEEELQKKVVKVNELIRKISDLQSDSEQIEKRIESLKQNEESLKVKEDEVENRLKEVIVREGQVNDMMKIQTNRQNILDEKEKELKVRERRSIYPQAEN